MIMNLVEAPKFVFTYNIQGLAVTNQRDFTTCNPKYFSIGLKSLT
ncbi:hypothetical protein BH23BAC1_BH23BAC1_04210 [soil metagenome]